MRNRVSALIASSKLIVVLTTLTACMPLRAQEGGNLVEKKVKTLGRSEPARGDVCQLKISADGTHCAFLRQRKDEGVVVTVDDKPRTRPGSIILKSFRFSEDGKRYGYFGYIKNKPVVVIDGKQHAGEGFFLGFSPSGRAICSLDEEGTRQPQLVIEGMRPIPVRPPDLAFDANALIFSPNGKRLAYRGDDGNVVLDGKPIEDSYKAGFRDRPAFSADGKRLAYGVVRETKTYMQAGTRAYGPYDEVRDPVFSRTGRLAWAACGGRQWRLVVDGKPGPPFDMVGKPVFSPDGKRLAYRALKGVRAGDARSGFEEYPIGGEQRVVVDGKPDADSYYVVGDPVFSPDGKHVAYWGVTKDRQLYVLCNGKKTRPYENVTTAGRKVWLAWSPDSRHLAWRIPFPGKECMIIDGAAGPVHDRIIVPERFDKVEGKCRYVVIDLGRVSLVETGWPAKGIWEDAFIDAK